MNDVTVSEKEKTSKICTEYIFRGDLHTQEVVGSSFKGHCGYDNYHNKQFEQFVMCQLKYIRPISRHMYTS